MPRVPIVPIAVVGAAVAGAAVLIAHAAARLDPGPAAPGTAQVEGRLPVGLWPADGSEPLVEGGVRGWRRMAAHLYHRDTAIDDAARARAIVLATFARRVADARRAVAFEVSVLGGYDASVVAAAWLMPQPVGTQAVEDRRDFARFGVGPATLAILEASQELDADSGRLAPAWGREIGLDPAHPDFIATGSTDLDDTDRARRGALLIEAATDRVHARA
ncbi:hypothetical protein BH09ACT4_BH09ACT4_06370 [soil metagenome]